MKEAQEALERVLNSEPRLVEAHLERAWLASARGEPHEAKAALDRAIELTEPRPWPVALQARSEVLRRAGKTYHALWDVERLLEQQGQGARLGPSESRDVQSRLDELVAAVDSRARATVMNGLGP